MSAQKRRSFATVVAALSAFVAVAAWLVYGFSEWQPLAQWGPQDDWHLVSVDHGRIVYERINLADLRLVGINPSRKDERTLRDFVECSPLDAQMLPNMSSVSKRRQGWLGYGTGQALRYQPLLIPNGGGAPMLRTNYLIVPHWPLLVLPLSFGAWVLRRRVVDWRAARRLGRGQCPRCGYDVRYTPARCPECGTWLSAPDTRTPSGVAIAEEPPAAADRAGG